MQADQVLVGRNNHPPRLPTCGLRQKQNIEDPLPVAGDKLVCLRNNRKKGLFNGGLWRVKSRTQPRSKSQILSMRLSPDEEFGYKVTKSLGATGLLRRRDRWHPVGAAQAL